MKTRKATSKSKHVDGWLESRNSASIRFASRVLEMTQYQLVGTLSFQHMMYAPLLVADAHAHMSQALLLQVV